MYNVVTTVYEYVFLQSRSILLSSYVANVIHSDVSISQFHFFYILFSFSLEGNDHYCVHHAECLIYRSDLYSKGKCATIISRMPDKKLSKILHLT